MVRSGMCDARRWVAHSGTHAVAITAHDNGAVKCWLHNTK